VLQARVCCSNAAAVAPHCAAACVDFAGTSFCSKILQSSAKLLLLGAAASVLLLM
jgi:hypothetical protein